MKLNKKLVNVLLVVLAVLVVALCALSVRREVVADRVAVLKTEGVTCGSCAAAIRQALQKEKGVASVALEEKGGMTVVAFDSKAVDPERLAGRVVSAGFGCRVTKVQTVGEYRAAGGALDARPLRECCCSRNNPPK